MLSCESPCFSLLGKWGVALRSCLVLAVFRVSFMCHSAVWHHGLVCDGPAFSLFFSASSCHLQRIGSGNCVAAKCVRSAGFCGRSTRKWNEWKTKHVYCWMSFCCGHSIARFDWNPGERTVLEWECCSCGNWPLEWISYNVRSWPQSLKWQVLTPRAFSPPGSEVKKKFCLIRQNSVYGQFQAWFSQ